MNLKALEKDICYVIKEEQIKLGFRKESISLYYPLSSLNSILETECDTEEMLQVLDEFKIKSKAEFGDIDVSVKGERFCIKLPDTASEYVNNTTEKTGFLYDLIATVSRHGITIEDVKNVFESYSSHVHFEIMEHEEFNYLIYFEDGTPDDSYYCFTEEGGHLIYHRFSKSAYKDTFNR